jgi:2-isopropylmalate synthase
MRYYPNLQLKMGATPIPPEKLTTLAEISYFVAEVANLPQDQHAPYVAKVLSHLIRGHPCSSHVKNPLTYQHIDPNQSGIIDVRLFLSYPDEVTWFEKSQQIGLDLDSRQAKEMLSEIKDLEAQALLLKVRKPRLNLMLHRLQPN